MSDLNLIPDPQIMAVQAIIFLSQIYVVKKFLVEPFSKLKRLREGATTGAESRSDELKREIAGLSRELEDRLNETYDNIKLIREKGKQDAKKAREHDIAQAHKEMTEIVHSARSAIKVNLQEERNKIPSLANTFIDEIYAMIAR